MAKLHFPLSFTYSSIGASPKVTADITMMLKTSKSKVVVSFELGTEVLESWPGRLGDVKVGVRAVYGDAE
jgi:hypothetical protein